MISRTRLRISNLKSRKVGALVLSRGFLGLKLCLCYCDYIAEPRALPDGSEKKLVGLPRSEEVRTTAFAIFIGHEYMPDIGCGLRGCFGLQHHVCLFSASYRLKDAVALAYGESLAVQKSEAGRSENEKDEQDAGGPSIDDKYDKDESKIKGSIAGNTDRNETPDWKSCAASITQG